MSERSELFYVKKCSVCNELTVAGVDCLNCRIDDILKTYNDKIIELTNKLIAQNKLLTNGVVIESDEFQNIVEIIRGIVADIETPYRLGVGDRINPNWENLNKAKKLILKWDMEKPK